MNKKFLLIGILGILLVPTIFAATSFNPGYFFGDEGLVIGLGTTKGNVISFRPAYDLKAFFCIGDANVINAEEIQFNKNKVIIKGKGACAFKLERRG